MSKLTEMKIFTLVKNFHMHANRRRRNDKNLKNLGKGNKHFEEKFTSKFLPHL